MNLVGTITGAAITGFTSPTYTMVADTAPSVNGKQWVVSALGGTQTGASVHSTSSPFFMSIFRPKEVKRLGALDQNGQLRSVPKNSVTLILGKGMVPLAGQASDRQLVRVEISTPAGSDTASPAEIKATLSLLGGVLWAKADEINDAIVKNLI